MQNDRITQNYWRGSEQQRGKVVYLPPRKSREEIEIEQLERAMDRFGAVLVRLAVLLGIMVVIAQIGIWKGWW